MEVTVKFAGWEVNTGEFARNREPQKPDARSPTPTPHQPDATPRYLSTSSSSAPISN